MLLVLDSDAAAGVDACICRRAAVSAFAEDRLAAEVGAADGTDLSALPVAMAIR
jgi:hypothetical protein